jgi:hypothetical protein
MAQLYDDLGRLVEGQKTANLSLQEIKGLIAASAKKAVGDAKPFAKGGDAAAPNDKLVKLFETYTKDFKDSVKEQKDYLKQMVDVLKEIAENKNEKKEKKPEKAPAKDKNAPKPSVWKSMENLAKQGLKKHSIGVHDTHCEGVLNKIYTTLQDIAKGAGGKAAAGAGGGGKGGKGGGSAAPAGGGAGGGGGGGAAAVEAEDRAKAARAEMTQLSITRIRETALKSILGTIQDQILGFDVMSQVLDGVLDKERKFVQDARKLSYEIEGATQGSKELMRTFEDIGKTSKLTGKTRQQFIDRYTKTVKMGLKDLKKAHAITVAQLNTEEQLGMEAGALGDTFVDWARGLKFSEGQIGDMGRGMRDIARFTGMTGEALEEVVKSSQTYIDNLKLAGTATAAQVKNIIELSANFKRVGIDGGKLMDAMTSTNKLLSANASTFSLLAKAAGQAGVYAQLFNGTLLQNKAAMKGMNREFMRTLNQFGVAGNSVEELRQNWNQLTDDAKARINIQLKAAFDVEAGELMGTIEAFENTSQTLADKLANVNKKLQQNLTLEEKALVLEEQRKLKLSASMGALTALDEAAKGAKSMGDALAKFGTRRGEFEADMNALGVAWTNEADVAKGAIQSAMDSVNKGLKAAGKQELSIDSSEIEKALKDPAAFRELTAKITKAEQEANTAAKAQLDPLSSAAQTLKEINDTLRNFANAGFSAIFDSMIGKLIIWLAVIAGAVLGIWKIWNEIQQLGEFVKQALDPAKYAREFDSLWGAGFKAEKDAAEAATHSGSIYTHDIHIEKIMGEVAGLLAQIKSCICSLNQNPTNAATPAPAAAASQSEAKPTAVEKSIRRHQEKQMKIEKRENKLKSANIKQESKNIQAEKALKAKDMKQEAPAGDFDAGILSKLGGDMAKNAAAIAILAVGVMALGAAIIFLGKKILDFLGLDMATVMQTAGTIAAVVAAGAAIAAAGIGVYKLLETKESKEFVEGAKTSYTDVLKAVGAILIIGPALVVLGAALVWLCQKVINAFGLDISTVAETAATIAAIAVAAGGIAYGVNEAVEALDEFKDSPLFQNPSKIIMPMLKGAAALLILAPAIVLLASAIVWMSQKILGAFGLDASTAAKVAMDVGAILIAAGVIALGVMGAAYGLAALGTLVTGLGEFTGGIGLGAAIVLMGKGALALLLLTPAILLLGIAIVKMAQGLMSVTGVDLGVAAEIAKNVAGVLGAAAVIAGACILSAYALAQLGIWLGSPAAVGMVPLIWSGAKAILILIPAMMLMATAILLLGQAMQKASGLDLNEAKKIAENVAGIIGAAGVIAGACLGAAAALSLLGLAMTTGTFWWMAVLMIPGAAALAVLTPAMIKMAQVIIEMAQGLMKGGIDPSTAAGVAENVSKLIEASGSIAKSVLEGAGFMALLGALVFSPLAWIMVGLMFLGAKAFQALAPAILRMTMAIVMLGQAAVAAAGGVGKLDATIAGVKKISEAITAVSEIFTTLYDKIVPLTSQSWWSFFRFSSTIQVIEKAIPEFAASFKTITNFVRDGIIIPLRQFGKEGKRLIQATKTAKLVRDAIVAAGDIMTTIEKVVVPMATKSWYNVFGSTTLEKLDKAVPKFQKSFNSIINFVKEGVVGPVNSAFRNLKKLSQATSVAKAIASVIGAVGPMMDSITKVVLDLCERPSFLLIFSGRSKAEKLEEAMPQFQATFEKVVKFVKEGVVGPVVSAFRNLKKVNSAIAVAKGIAESVAAIANVVDVLANKITPMTERGGWWARNFGDARSKMDKIEGMIPDFRRVFAIMVNFLKDSLIGIVVAAFPNLQAVNGVLPIVEGVGKAVAAIAEMMDALVNKLAPMAQRGGWWARNFGDARSPLEKLEAAKPDIERSFLSIVNFIRGLMGSVQAAFPDLQRAEAAINTIKKVGEALTAVQEIMETFQEISRTVNPWGAMSAIFGDIFGKVSPLEAAIPQIQQTFMAITKFVKEGIVQPVSAMNVGGLAKAVQKLKLMSQAMELMEDMVNSVQGMMGLTQGSSTTTTTGMLWWKKTVTTVVQPMTTQMQAAIPAIRQTFAAIVDFVKDGIVAPIEPLKTINLKGTVKTMIMAEKAISLVPEIIGGLNDAMNELLAFTNSKFTKSGAMNTEIAARYKGWFEWIAYFVREGIVKPMEGIGDVGMLKVVAKRMHWAAKILDATPTIIDGLIEAMDGILELGQDKFTSSGAKNTQIAASYKGWFEWVAYFVREAIVKPMGNIGEVGELKNVGKKMIWAAKILDSFPKIVTGLNNSMDAVNALAAGKFLTTKEDNTKIANNYRGWFEWVAYFVRAAIIEPAKGLGEVRELQTVAKIMCAAANILIAFPKIVRGLNGSMDAVNELAAGKFLTTREQNTAIAARYKGWFEWVAYFVRTAIIEPAKGLGDVQELAVTAKAITYAEKILTATPRVIIGLGKAMDEINNLAEDKFTSSGSKNTQIAARYRGWFEWVAYFVRVALVEPVLTEFPDIKKLMDASRIISAMQRIIAAVPKIIIGLSQTMGLMSGASGYLDDDFPMDKIMMYKDRFAVWFRRIAVFLRDGIVDPILTEIPEPKTILLAQRILTAMNAIIRTVPNIIRGTAAAMGLMSGSSQYLDEDFPMDKIMMYKNTFAVWFRNVAAFIRDGIVDPILTELPEPKTILLAQRILTAMNAIISRLPVMIRNLSRMFMPMNPNDCIADSPIAMLAAGVEQFKAWFRSITSFLREGIIWPIIESLPTEEEIAAAEANLGVTVEILKAVPPFIQKLAGAVMDLVGVIMGQPFLGAFTQYAATWFGGIATSLNTGIISPIRMMPSSDELDEVNAQLTSLGDIVRKTTEVCNTIAESIGPLVSGWWWFSPIASIGGQASKFAYYWDGISKVLNEGIITPIKKNLPASAEIEEAAKRINSLADVLAGLKNSLDMLAQIMQELQGMNIDMEMLKALPIAELAALGMGGKMGQANTGAAAGGEAVNGSTPTEKVQDEKTARKEQEASTSMSKDMDQFMITAITPGNGLYVTDLALIQTLKEIFKDGIEVSTQVEAKVSEQNKQESKTLSAEELKKLAEKKSTTPTGPLSQARANALGTNQGAGVLSGAMPRGSVRPAMDRASGGLNPAVVMPRGQTTPEERMRRMGAAADRTGATGVNPYTQRRDRLASQRASQRSAETQAIETAQSRIAQQAQRATGAVGAETTTARPTTPTASAVPPVSDVHSQVRQNSASTEPATTQVNSPELSEIAAAASEETELSKQMVTLLEQMLKLFKGGSSQAGNSGGGGQSTLANNIVQKPNNYYRWPTGNQFQQGAKQVLNLGAGIV